MKETTATAGVETTPYLYEESLPSGMLAGVTTFGDGPKPGESVPDFDMLTTDGRRVRREDSIGKSPVLLTFASLTCPMTAAAAAPLKRLHERFAGRAEFISVYVREAFPGDRVPQARDRDEKLTFAQRYKDRDEIPWPVAVDSLDGVFHRAMGSHPNACYIMDKDGRVAFRALWSSDEAAIGRALELLLTGQELGEEGRESRSAAVPALAGLGCMDRALSEAGPAAQSRVLRKAAPVYGLGKLAGFFEPLAPALRGAAAITVAVGAILGAGYALTRTRKRR